MTVRQNFWKETVTEYWVFSLFAQQCCSWTCHI